MSGLEAFRFLRSVIAIRTSSSVNGPTAPSDWYSSNRFAQPFDDRCLDVNCRQGAGFSVGRLLIHAMPL